MLTGNNSQLLILDIMVTMLLPCMLVRLQVLHMVIQANLTQLTTLVTTKQLLHMVARSTTQTTVVMSTDSTLLPLIIADVDMRP